LESDAAMGAARFEENSVFRYGVNPDIELSLSLPLDSECIHAGLLVHFGRSLKTPCKYLELGVSVGNSAAFRMENNVSVKMKITIIAYNNWVIWRGRLNFALPFSVQKGQCLTWFRYLID
jgi:hypothetical protein